MASQENSASLKGNHVRIAGAVAGVASGWTKVAVGHGFDTIKTRLQVAPNGTYKGAIDCFWKTVRNESPLALYKGGPTPGGCLGSIRLLIARVTTQLSFVFDQKWGYRAHSWFLGSRCKTADTLIQWRLSKVD
ncbi:hypothetical protein OPQ81_006972 [Rhizoctonia solani]|nr:hypothetical protein OPQ81_006972 [Rhizoctonia solani]